MPVVLRHGAFRVFFYSNEGDPREPPHVHVRLGRDEAKLWLTPQVRVCYNDGLSLRALAEVTEVVARERQRLERAWHEHFR